MQRQQLLLTVIKVFHCHQTKAMATSWVSERPNGNSKQKESRACNFNWEKEVTLQRPSPPIGFGGDPAAISDPSLRWESQTPSPCHHQTLGTPLAGWYLHKKWWEWELLLPHFPFPPYLGAPLGGVLIVYSQSDADGVCVAQHGSCIKHAHVSSVSADHIPVSCHWLRRLVFQMLGPTHYHHHHRHLQNQRTTIVCVWPAW